jgi:nitroreductase
MPLMEALADRRSQRKFSERGITRQTLSNMLWAAWGVNRPSGKRTAPTASNKQEITVYAALKEGCFRYIAEENALLRISDRDLRALTGRQDFVDQAPLNLVFTADHNKQSSEFYAACDTGFVSQNVYLFCASEGLATVVRGWVPREKLARAMGLPEHERIMLCQTVGYPA